jgi:4-alpha-glucanotransferase
MIRLGRGVTDGTGVAAPEVREEVVSPAPRRGPRRRKPGAPVTDPWGITSGYLDALGQWRETSAETRRALLDAMRVDPSLSGPAPAPVRVVTQGDGAPLPDGDLLLEGGGTVPVIGRLPSDAAPGYHRLRSADGEIQVIVAPASCPRPGRIWGWAAQVYATRSGASWGIGDLADLRRLAAWSWSLGARVVLVNPLSAPTPVEPQHASPYYPSSRRFRNPIYLRIEEVPGAEAAGVELEALARAGRALNEGRRIDRDDVHRLKDAALRALWARFPGDPAFDAYRREQGQALDDWATFCAITERHGGNWTRWPAPLRRADGEAVGEFRRTNADRVAFHAWLQWQIDVQLGRAAAACPIVQDLPIGVDPEGADAWAWQDVLARDTSVGAPPDRYIRRGQDWGLPPFVPHRLRAAGYAPFIETIRAALRHAGGLRIDHVMGLFRLFWVPAGLPPARGGFVRYPADELLGIVALESRRAGAFVVGEDLGTVEAGVREALAARGVMSYRCVWFETRRPARYPELSLAAVTTHDLPTIAGLWTGADLKAQEALGLAPNAAGIADIRARLARMIRLPDGAPVERVIERTHDLLGGAASLVVTATLEDALAVAERPNMPSTTTQWPNWSVALPAPLEQIESLPLPRAIARSLAGPRPVPAGGEESPR